MSRRADHAPWAPRAAQGRPATREQLRSRHWRGQSAPGATGCGTPVGVWWAAQPAPWPRRGRWLSFSRAWLTPDTSTEHPVAAAPVSELVGGWRGRAVGITAHTPAAHVRFHGNADVTQRRDAARFPFQGGCAPCPGSRALHWPTGPAVAGFALRKLLEKASEGWETQSESPSSVKPSVTGPRFTLTKTARIRTVRACVWCSQECQNIRIMHLPWPWPLMLNLLNLLIPKWNLFLSFLGQLANLIILCLTLANLKSRIWEGGGTINVWFHLQMWLSSFTNFKLRL